MVILRKHGVTYIPPVVLDELQKYIFSSYVFVLPANGEFTTKQFSEEIKKCFDLSNPINFQVYQSIRDME
jgi:hypothetical protein